MRSARPTTATDTRTTHGQPRREGRGTGGNGRAGQRGGRGAAQNASATKFAALLADLQALREVEPDFRAVIFTRFDAVQVADAQLLCRRRSA